MRYSEIDEDDWLDRVASYYEEDDYEHTMDDDDVVERMVRWL